MTLTLEIPTQADYDLLLQLLQKFEGVRIAAPKHQKVGNVAEESEVYSRKNDSFDIREYQGCLTYPATFEETEAKLKSMRAEWDRDFF